MASSNFPTYKKPMSSFEKRYLSFKDFTPSTISTCQLASAFFISETSTSCYCYLCRKNLDHWVKNDIPIKEHHTHHNNCPLFNLHSLHGRSQTYPSTFDQAKMKSFAKQGFFYYKIKEKGDYDLFCFRCGFYLNERTNFVGNHLDHCTRRKRSGKFFMDNRHDVFYVDLLMGKIKLEDYCFRNVYIPDNMKEALLELLDKDSVFYPCGEVLNGRIKNTAIKEEAMLDDEIEKVLRSIDERFQDRIDELEIN